MNIDLDPQDQSNLSSVVHSSNTEAETTAGTDNEANPRETPLLSPTSRKRKGTRNPSQGVKLVKSKTLDNMISREYKRYFGYLVLLILYNIASFVFNFFTFADNEVLKGLAVAVDGYFLIAIIFLLIGLEFRSTNINDIGLILLTLGIAIRVGAYIYSMIHTSDLFEQITNTLLYSLF